MNTFTGSDNKVYHLSPLTLGDVKQFVSYAQYRPWRLFASMKDTIPADVFNEQSTALLKECSHKKVNPNSPEVTDCEQSPDGQAYLIYLSLKRNHPNITIEEVEDILTVGTLQEVSQQLSAVSGIGSSKKNSNPPRTKR